MNPSEFPGIFQAEESHWWYLGMEKITQSLLSSFYPSGGDLRILDAGCGTGFAMTTYLTQYGGVTGLEVSSTALSFCRRRNARRLVQATAEQIPFVNGMFDLITCFDVLCDAVIQDDGQPAREFYRVLKPGGRVLLRLPAYPWLHGWHDTAVQIARRYTAKTAQELLTLNGFKIDRVSYANMLLFPLAAGIRIGQHWVSNRGSRSDIAPEPDWLNRILKAILSLEAKWITSTGLPFGLSIIVVGRKP